MTKDKAIKLLVNIAAYDIDSQRGEEKFEALWMAIKALERMPKAERWIKLKGEDSKETMKTLIDIRNHCDKTADCSVCPYCTCDTNKSYSCCLYGIPSDWRDLDEVFV